MPRVVATASASFEMTLVEEKLDVGTRIQPVAMIIDGKNMKSSIKIIKRKRNDNSNESRNGKTEKTAEKSTREMVSTVKTWVHELQEKRRAQGHTLFQAAGLVNIGHGPSGQERAGP